MRNRSALQFVLIIGIVNFFADFTYEGARGIVGPFLGSLGASAAIVGFVAGLSELLGYGLRSVSGYFADKSHKHWAFAFWDMRSTCWPCRRWPLPDNGRSPRLSWFPSASAAAFANRVWKPCFHTPADQLAPAGYLD